jgi:hypothetical protein
MTGVQQRLKLKQTPIDTWSVREQLTLASAVLRTGDQVFTTFTTCSTGTAELATAILRIGNQVGTVYCTAHTCFIQCGGSGSARIRNFLQDPDP